MSNHHCFPFGLQSDAFDIVGSDASSPQEQHGRSGARCFDSEGAGPGRLRSWKTPSPARLRLLYIYMYIFIYSSPGPRVCGPRAWLLTPCHSTMTQCDKHCWRQRSQRRQRSPRTSVAEARAKMVWVSSCGWVGVHLRNYTCGVGSLALLSHQ